MVLTLRVGGDFSGCQSLMHGGGGPIRSGSEGTYHDGPLAGTEQTQLQVRGRGHSVPLSADIVTLKEERLLEQGSVG